MKLALFMATIAVGLVGCHSAAPRAVEKAVGENPNPCLTDGTCIAVIPCRPESNTNAYGDYPTFVCGGPLKITLKVKDWGVNGREYAYSFDEDGKSCGSAYGPDYEEDWHAN